MKSENTIVKIGDVVKSLDFVGINDCFYVGLVVGISEMDGTFRAKTIKRVWQGQIDKKIPSDFFTNATYLSDEIPERFMTKQQIAEYNLGFDDNEASGNFKEWE